MITMEIQGLEQVKAEIQRIGKKAEDGVAKAVKDTALEVIRDVKKRIKRGPKSGTKYWRVPGEDGLMRVYAGSPNAGVTKLVAVFKADGKQNLSLTHKSSAAGEAPASDTGTLASSTYFTQSGKLSATVGSRLAYAYWLETGTTKIKPRPSWTPAVEAAAPKLQKRIEDAIRKAAQ